MKKILYGLLAGATMLLGSCSKESADSLAPSGAETTFTISVEELQTRVKPNTNTTITPTRYIMEVWSENGTTAENVIKDTDGTMTSRLEIGNGSFTAILDKTKAYTCLFWADYSTADDQEGVYNAASLKTVRLNNNKVATEAYYTKVDVAKGTNATVAVMLKRAVAKISLVETAAVETGKSIAVTYINNTAFNAFDGTASSPVASYTSTVTTIAGKLTGTLGELYMLSGAGGATLNMSIKYADETAKSLTNVPVKQNFNTNIRGEFSSLISKTFTVTADDEWYLPDNDLEFMWEKAMQLTIKLDPSDLTFIIPFDEEGTTPADLTIDWGDGSNTSIGQNTDLSTPATGEALTHTYGGQGTYKITITSAALPTQTQMPVFSFGLYRTSNDNSSKLQSMDSPMLNMGTTNLSGCFATCTGLIQIPGTLFVKNTTAESFYGCFIGCTGLLEIPEKLFEKNTAVTDFVSCFSGCIGLLEIPEKLFEKNTAVTNFENCFGDCEGLTEIPEKLFDKNEAVENFFGCFDGCLTLSAIPEKLFEKNTKATDFTECFQSCEGLMEIPAKLFEKNTAAESFRLCFDNCTELKEVPNGLFATNKAVDHFEHCFRSCSKAKINPNIFCNEATESDSRFAGKEMYFGACFKDCGSTLAPGEGGTAPALWNYTVGEGTNYYLCFDGATAVTNVDDIPTTWGGANVVD